MTAEFEDCGGCLLVVGVALALAALFMLMPLPWFLLVLGGLVFLCGLSVIA